MVLVNLWFLKKVPWQRLLFGNVHQRTTLSVHKSVKGLRQNVSFWVELLMSGWIVPQVRGILQEMLNIEDKQQRRAAESSRAVKNNSSMCWFTFFVSLLRSIRCLRNIIHWNLITTFILRNVMWFLLQLIDHNIHESNEVPRPFAPCTLSTELMFRRLTITPHHRADRCWWL